MGTAIENIEERRVQEQARLDALKTAAQRNKWGQFATPPELALSIARHTQSLMQDCDGRVNFLDPAIGTGSFFSALSHTLSPEKIAVATGVELDPLFAECAASLWADRGLRIIQADFTSLRPERHFNLVLTNPPYVRHHHLPANEKLRLKSAIARSLNLNVSGLAGLYCYFLLRCHDWMQEGGLGAWLIPSEFMDVNYGAALRKDLSECVTLLHIHRFSPADVQFRDALVSSAIVIFRKAPPPLGHAARFSLAGSIERPQSDGLRTIPDKPERTVITSGSAHVGA
jgi:type I restriction-modification system DNA methylase subunit